MKIYQITLWINNEKKSEITIEELLKLYATGQRDFTRFMIKDTDQYFDNGIDLRGVKFRGDSLNNLVFSLQNSNLSGADLRGINFPRANLDCCNLSGALLNKAFLWRAGFDRGNLSEANFTETDLQEASFFKTNLRKANLSKTWLFETDFYCADLSRANFVSIQLLAVSFQQ